MIDYLIYFNAAVNVAFLLFVLGLIVDFIAAKMGLKFKTSGKLEEWWARKEDGRRHALIDRLQVRAKHQVEMVDRFVLIVEDLIRAEPERAEPMEITRLELKKYREELVDWSDVMAGANEPIHRQVRTVWRLKRKYRRQQREEG